MEDPQVLMSESGWVNVDMVSNHHGNTYSIPLDSQWSNRFLPEQGIFGDSNIRSPIASYLD